VPASGPDSDEKSVKAKLSKAFADMQPDAGRIEAKVDASEITADVLRERLRTQSGAPAAAAATADAPAASYIPAELRQYLGMIRLRVEIDPAMAPGEVNRRVDAFLRDRYPELAVTPYEVRGSGQAGAAGEFASLEVWVAQPYAGARAAVPLSVFWTDAVSGALGGEQDFASTTSFEPTMAAEAWDKAVVAILFSLAAMIVYIWVRFSKLSSGVAAVVALVHDVVITLGAVTAAAMLSDTFLGTTLMLSDFKINLPMVGAFLTLVGYSINDTIVVFDRIRENRGKYGEMSVAVVNNSINQTVSRTVLTSVTVLLAVLALYVFAGRSSSIHGLAFVMLFGTLVGTYSSIAIASPILVLRDYLYRLFVWVYPILGVGLMVYYAFVYETPGEFFGSAVGWVWLVVQLAWVAVATSIVRCDAYGKPWPPAQKSPGLAKALAVVSMAAPLAAVVLVAVMILKPGSSATPWAGPAALGMLATAPVTWALARMAWGSASQKR
jgi:preprotein translocase SecF subunit